jgi:hypothetical protein
MEKTNEETKKQSAEYQNMVKHLLEKSEQNN